LVLVAKDGNSVSNFFKFKHRIIIMDLPNYLDGISGKICQRQRLIIVHLFNTFLRLVLDAKQVRYKTQIHAVLNILKFLLPYYH
jgi:hypothetical protein